MKKPVIGVTPLFDTAKKRIWMLPNYMDAVLAAGGLPVVLPLGIGREDVDALTAQCDGFLFTGGQDVSPALYGEETLHACGEVSPERDAMEGLLLPAALAAGKPVFGICRGLQFLNATLGGALYQDLTCQRESALHLAHRQASRYDIPVHTVDLCGDGPLPALLGKEPLRVNSIHHQAVRELAPRLRPAAYARDGLVEAAWLPEQAFCIGVQWHPEYLYREDAGALRLFRAFVDACRI